MMKKLDDDDNAEESTKLLIKPSITSVSIHKILLI